jgi:phage FluMu protein Com
MIVQQLICDNCKKVILEKGGETYLSEGKFPISEQEAVIIDKEHRGHECHIEVVEKEGT